MSINWTLLRDSRALTPMPSLRRRRSDDIVIIAAALSCAMLVLALLINAGVVP